LKEFPLHFIVAGRSLRFRIPVSCVRSGHVTARHAMPAT
jgi:hypothetical protein